MVLKKRKRTVIGKMAMEKEYPKITFEQAIDLVVSAKSAEGLRPRTLKDYRKDWSYFVKWLEQKNNCHKKQLSDNSRIIRMDTWLRGLL